MKKLLVIDGNSILNRAFYGIRPLTNSSGLHTNALFGTLNILLKQIESVKPDYAAIAFDLKAPTFRHERYAEYKAGRKGMPEELAMQLPYSKKLASLLGLTVLEREGYEADDILGTLAKMGEREGVHSYILTGDRDALQLISDSTTVLLATNNDTVTFDRAAFFDKYGVQPESFVDVKALMGDSSDNIPGVPGIGEKTAFKLIAKFESIDAVYENLDNAGLGSSARQKMENGRDLAYLSKFLATIEKNVPLGVDLYDIATKPMKKSELHALLRELEFTSHIKRLKLSDQDNKSVQEQAENNPLIAPATADLQTNESEGGQLSFDLGAESDAPDFTAKNTVSVSVGGIKGLKAKGLALAYDESTVALCDEKNCYLITGDRAEIFAEIARVGTAVTVYDAKACYADFGEAKINVSDDIMLMAYVCEPSRSGYALADLSEIYLHKTMGKTPEDKAISIYGLQQTLLLWLNKENMTELYRKVEMPLARVLYDMETAGIKLDCDSLAKFGERLAVTEKEYAKKIYALAGKEFNINSPKQLGVVLFEELGLPAGKKTQTGYSTNAEVLEKLHDKHPIIPEILEYRAVAKLRSTYTDALIKAADENGRLHTVFSQTTAVTGRLASSEPNLQNIPIRTALGSEMRKFFVATDESHTLIDADYSQIELRILAHIADDEVMKNAFVNGQDIHTVTASQVFNVPISEVTGEMRKRAKAVNFGIVYGMGEFSLSQDIGVSRKEAGEYIRSYFEKYRGISEYLSSAIENAKTNGYTTTVFGRKRQIPELKSDKAVLRAFGERAAMNSPIQGSSADIIKLAMINVHRALKQENINARLILQIHDELIVEASKDCAERAAEILKREMENVARLSVPLTVDLNMGASWYDCH